MWLGILLVDSRIVGGQLNLGYRPGRSLGEVGPGTEGGVSKLRDWKLSVWHTDSGV